MLQGDTGLRGEERGVLREVRAGSEGDPDGQILHDKLNIPASSRASVGIYNTKDDLEKLNEAINNCKKIFNL